MMSKNHFLFEASKQDLTTPDSRAGKGTRVSQGHLVWKEQRWVVSFGAPLLKMDDEHSHHAPGDII